MFASYVKNNKQMAEGIFFLAVSTVKFKVINQTITSLSGSTDNKTFVLYVLHEERNVN